MTLKELRESILSTEGVKLPTAAALKRGSATEKYSKEMTDGSKLTVYENGFALYETPDGSTVMRTDLCGDYTYSGNTNSTTFSESSFEDMDWWVRLVLEGEDRIEHNRKIRAERFENLFYDEAFLNTYLNVCSDTAENEILREALNLALSIMTERQREVVILRYLYGLSLEEISKKYGNSIQAIASTLRDVKKKMKKNRKKFFDYL